MKKTIINVCMTLLIAVLMTSCSGDDDDSDLSSIERSLVGCWQVVEHFNYSFSSKLIQRQII